MKKILIVEDDEALRLLLEEILSLRYEPITMKEGMAAFQWLSTGHEVDLIVSDLNMPFLSGDELIRQIRISGFSKEIPIIILSAIDTPESRKLCMDLGASHYVTKPFEPEHLMATIDQVLEYPMPMN